METAPGAPQANSNKFPYSILIKNWWDMILEVPGPIPSDLLIKAVLNMNGNAHGAPGQIPSDFFIKL